MAHHTPHPKRRHGKGKKRRMTKYIVNELSGVDAPAQRGARALIIKARGKADAPAIEKNGDGIVVITSSTAGHAHGFRIWPGERGGMTWDAQNPANADPHDHAWTVQADGTIFVSENMSHGHLVDRADLLAAFMAVGPLQRGDSEIMSMAKSLGVEFIEGGGVTDLFQAGEPGATKEGDMPEANTDQTKALEKKLARTEKLAELNDAQKAHFGGLDEKAQDGFLAKSADERQAEVDAVLAKAADADPVAYTCADGTEIRKSDGPLLAKMAKERDDDRKELAKARAVADNAGFEKRAGEHLDALPGSIEVRGAVVKAIESIPDEKVREAAGMAVIAGNKAMKAAFASVGSGTSPTAIAKGDAEGELDRLAKARAAEKSIDYFDAYDEVSKGNPELAKRALTGEN